MNSTPELTRTRSSLRHRRQVFWQILLPVILAGAGVIALVVLAAIASTRGSTVSATWANIATVWLIIPLIFTGLFFAIFIAGMIFLFARLLRNIPTYTRLAQLYLQIFSVKVDTILHRVVQPQINMLSRWAAWRSFWKKIGL
ncbi:MAG: hypothetical protein D9V45_12190 [Chloroflexi bacterium]|nr:hypothetical protein [Anaerolinea sp.]TDA65347.1 MAG: hypothetical protein D9V45_12190 [Chloroflexota bacterium]